MTDTSSIPLWADPDLSCVLEDLCRRGECEEIEFKQQLPEQARDISKSIAAFASTNGGRLIFGVADDGRVVGLPSAETPEGRDKISQRIIGTAKNVSPPVQPSIAWIYHQGLVVCVVTVKKGNRPLYFSGDRPMVRRGNTSRPALPSEVDELVLSGYAPTTTRSTSPTSRTLGKRLKRVLDLMNKARKEPWTIADLAQAMDLDSPRGLDAAIAGDSVSFELLHRFCTRFSVNKEWLISGRRSPFASAHEIRYLPLDYLEVIENSRPEIVYAVRSRAQAGEAFFVVQSDEMNYCTLPNTWHVSSQVGGGGMTQLLSLFSLFKRWSDSSTPYLILGRYVDEKVANAVKSGTVFPGVIERGPLSHWWDDLTDLEYKWTTRKGSESEYGLEFVLAQDIIRRFL